MDGEDVSGDGDEQTYDRPLFRYREKEMSSRESTQYLSYLCISVDSFRYVAAPRLRVPDV